MVSGMWGQDPWGTEPWGTKPQLPHCLCYTNLNVQIILAPAPWRSKKGRVFTTYQAAFSFRGTVTPSP